MMDNNQEPLDLNQSSLQDFMDCPRRFQLKTLQKHPWPAAFSLPIDDVENAIHTGNSFHHLVRQYFLGISIHSIRKVIDSPVLLEMMETFEPFARRFQNATFFSEQLLQMPFGDFRLVAKYDFIVQFENRFIIIDWKTSKKKPPLSVLRDKMQTYLYPFIFYHTGQTLFQDQVIKPDMIDFIYFYPLSSEPEILLPYSSATNQDFYDQLSTLLGKVSKLNETEQVFPMTNDIQLCSYCPYRSYCDRNDSIGALTEIMDIEQEELNDTYFDLDQIQEIEF